MLRGRERAGFDLLLEKGARLAEQVPRTVFLVFADPDVEVAPDPGTGVQGGELLAGRMMPQVILDGATVQAAAVVLDAGVDRAQKSLAAIAKVSQAFSPSRMSGITPVSFGTSSAMWRRWNSKWVAAACGSFFAAMKPMKSESGFSRKTAFTAAPS